MSRKARAEADAAMAAVDNTAGDDAAAAPPPRRRSRPPAAAASAENVSTVVNFAPPAAADMPLEQLCPSPLNPRRNIDAADLAPLADSIAANGILQPLLVRPASLEANAAWLASGHIAASYEIICGARRHAAASLAHQQGHLSPEFTVPIRIRECDDAELVLLAATENLARADMHPLDEAAVFAAMRPHVKPIDGQTTEAAIGKALGVSERTVFRRLSLLRCAPEVLDALRDKKITLAHAQAYSLGQAERQREILADQLTGNENQWGEPLRADDIKSELTSGDEGQAPVPVERAIFDLANYTGEIIEDPETEDRYFAATPRPTTGCGVMAEVG